jgi:hypothetical protein
MAVLVVHSTGRWRLGRDLARWVRRHSSCKWSIGRIPHESEDEALGRVVLGRRPGRFRARGIVGETRARVRSRSVPGMLHQQLHGLLALSLSTLRRRQILAFVLLGAVLPLQAPVALARPAPATAQLPRPESCPARPEDPLRFAQMGAPANACCTQYSPCPLGQPSPIGFTCWCPSPYGPIYGTTCRL